eukprot:2703697-Rhodomonas_salina.1
MLWRSVRPTTATHSTYLSLTPRKSDSADRGVKIGRTCDGGGARGHVVADLVDCLQQQHLP